MENFLEELCGGYNIQLVYTNNKITVLSSGIQKNTPIIRVHNFFKTCPKDVAQAIVSYYTDYDNKDNYLDKIKDYSNKHFSSENYKIKPPNRDFESLLLKPIIKQTMTRSSTNSNDDKLQELEISYISKKDFWGNISQMEPDQTIEATTDNLIELDIIVDFSGS